MKSYKIIVKKDEKEIELEVKYASNYINRLLGLMGKKKFNGLLFKQESSNKYLSTIHTCFMKVPIDILYVNQDMIIQEYTTLNPWKIYIPKYNNTKYIIELPRNTISENNIKINDEIKVVEFK